MVFTAGTTIRDAHGRDWAYLLWQGSTPTLLRGHAFALYSKPGDANSAAPYQRKAIVTLQTDPLVIEPLLRRSLNLGGDLALLDSNLAGLFEQLMPPGSSTVAQKLAAVILGAQSDAEHFENLILLSRMHPGVALSLGLAHAERIGAGQTTFELRDFNLAKSEDIAVVGRVTVTAGAPTVLPAPGRPVQVPEYPRPTSAKGDLNVKLRWATPPELRQLALMSYGFNLYRMTRAFAEAPERGFDLAPPSPATLLQVLRDHPADAQRVNRAPILADKDFDPDPGDPSYVKNFDPAGGDPTTFFAHDDNHRFEPGQMPFRSGDRFYYFVTARDLLGRDGLVSPGRLVTICDRLPPPVPARIKVENDYAYAAGAASQRLKVTWDQNDNVGTEQTVQYRVYRWDSPKQLHALAANPGLNLVTIVDHLPGEPRNSFIDIAVSHPGDGVLGKTYWYTVRAVDQGVPACEQNLSGHSGPVFGVLRDRAGPGVSPDTRVEVLCVCPTNWFTKVTNITAAGLGTNRYHFRAVNERRSPEIVWAEFSALTPKGVVPLGRKAFPAGQNVVSADYSLPRPYAGPPPLFRSRVGAASGKISNYATQTVNSATFPQGSNAVLGVCFQSDVTALRVRTEECEDEAHECPPGAGCVDVPEGCAETPLTAREYRFYRRVDDGPLELLGQGETAPGEIVCVPDTARPANAATLCYFMQFFDEHGNAGPLQRLGECFTAQGRTPLPAPMLARARPAGTEANPLMVLRWFCPPYGLERFRISISEGQAELGRELTATPPLRLETPDALDIELPVGGEAVRFFMSQYRTPRIGPSFGEGAEFTVTIQVRLNQRYTVFVHAVEKGGRIDETKRSNIEQFTWTPLHLIALGDPPSVPWPARPLPPVNAGLVPPNDAGRGLRARFFQQPLQPYTGGAVRIGEVNFPGYNENIPAPPPYATPGLADPRTHLYPTADGRSVLPIALYRVQVPSAKFPSFSGDVVQVSPLLERIAYRQEPITPLGPVALIYDPFIAVISEPGGAPTPGQTNPLKGIYLLDTQPVIRGARYKYLLVRFHGAGEVGAPGEIHAVVPTNEVEVP